MILATALVAGTARGQSKQSNDEETLIRRGVESRRVRKDSEALELFREAYRLGHSARAAGQMGLAELALGRWVDAEIHLEEATAAAGDSWVVKNKDTLNSSLERVRQHVGRLEILGNPAGAEIVIEGTVAGTLPLAAPLRVRSGDCRFLVRSPGYEIVSRDVVVGAGDLTRETVNLSRRIAAGDAAPLATVPPPANPTSPANAASVSGNAAGSAGTATQTSATPAGVASRADAGGQTPGSDSASGGGTLRTAGIVLGSVGAVVIATGLVFGLKARSTGEEASKSPTYDPGVDDRGHRYEVLQYVGYGLGAVLVGAGITTFVLGSNREHDVGQSRVTFLPAVGGGMAILARQF